MIAPFFTFANQYRLVSYEERDRFFIGKGSFLMKKRIVSYKEKLNPSKLFCQLRNRQMNQRWSPMWASVRAMARL